MLVVLLEAERMWVVATRGCMSYRHADPRVRRPGVVREP